MKKRGEKLQRHYQQALEYWLHLVPNRPEYVVLCNFDEFWIYDLNQQLDEPMDRVALNDLLHRFTALNFLFPEKKTPLFDNDRVAVTRAAADKVAGVFNALRKRGEDRDLAQRFILQCVVALFAQSIDLLPHGLFSELLADCRKDSSSYDLLGGLFRQMNCATPARGGHFVNVPYFNGGLFTVVDPIELTGFERDLLAAAASEDWAKVKPPIFGTLFEGSMDAEERHAFGAHFTSEADIQKVVLPTIVRPWRERIAAAETARDLLALRRELLHFHVLDPACGSGNFLYVAYRELKRVEMDLLDKISANVGKKYRGPVREISAVSASRFHGIDIKPFAVELAKVTLMLAKKLALDESEAHIASGPADLPFDLAEQALPLENLDANIRCDDALFCHWPQAQAIVGNPPYLGSRFLAKEHGYEYARKVHDTFPDVPKMADYCVYWFRRAHDILPSQGRAGLVATNTIRQNETRQASLDYILDNGGSITEAVSTQVWSGEAAVHVSIVNWLKGEEPGPKKIFTQRGDNVDSEWTVEETEKINSSLSTRTDVSKALPLQANRRPKRCFQGQNPVSDGFFLTPKQAEKLLQQNQQLRDVLFPYMIGRDLVENDGPTRWVIDFGQRNMLDAMRYGEAFERVKTLVMPGVLEKAEKEKKATGKESTRWVRMANRWWQFRDYQPGTMTAIAAIPRYIACPRVTKRPIFEFVSNNIHPDTALIVFPLADDYSFGILQSNIHWAWFTARCSTLKGDFRYTSDTVFDTFVWPQSPTIAQARKIAEAAVSLRALRRKVMAENNWSLRELYRSLELPGRNPLRDAHAELDAAVRAAYGMKNKDDPLVFLLALNAAAAEREARGESVTAPGLPPCVSAPSSFITPDCIQPPQL
jgi:SAM-dependent methyltransferase